MHALKVFWFKKRENENLLLCIFRSLFVMVMQTKLKILGLPLPVEVMRIIIKVFTLVRPHFNLNILIIWNSLNLVVINNIT